MSITIHENHIINNQTLKTFQTEDTLGNDTTWLSELDHIHYWATGVQESSAFTHPLQLWIEIYGKRKLGDDL